MNDLNSIYNVTLLYLPLIIFFIIKKSPDNVTNNHRLTTAVFFFTPSGRYKIGKKLKFMT